MKTLLLILALLIGFPSAIAAQDECLPEYTDLDYHLYALDAAVGGDFDLAETLYTCWIASAPDSATPWLERAAMRANLSDDIDGALRDLERAGELDGSSTLIEVRRLAIFLLQGDYDAAIPIVDALLESGDYRFLGEDYGRLRRAAYGLRIIAHVEAGAYDDALADVEAGYNRVSEDDLIAADAPVMLAIGRAFQAMGEDDPALRAFTAYVRLAGADADPEIAALVAAGG